MWRQAAILGGLGTVLVAITPSACTAPAGGAGLARRVHAPRQRQLYLAQIDTGARATLTPQAPGTAPPGPAAGLTLVPSPSAPKPFVPPTIAPNSAIGPATIVLPESTFHLNDHVPHSLIPKTTKVAYELTGFLDVKEAGLHSLGLLIDEGSRGTCAARGAIENQVLFEDDTIVGADKAFDPLIGAAKLDLGLYEARIWIACSNSDAKPLRVRIIARTPSMSAPDVLPAARTGHKEL